MRSELVETLCEMLECRPREWSSIGADDDKWESTLRHQRSGVEVRRFGLSGTTKLVEVVLAPMVRRKKKIKRVHMIKEHHEELRLGAAFVQCQGILRKSEKEKEKVERGLQTQEILEALKS